MGADAFGGKEASPTRGGEQTPAQGGGSPDARQGDDAEARQADDNAYVESFNAGRLEDVNNCLQDVCLTRSGTLQ